MAGGEGYLDIYIYRPRGISSSLVRQHNKIDVCHIYPLQRRRTMTSTQAMK
jgi:hypothetical protein